MAFSALIPITLAEAAPQQSNVALFMFLGFVAATLVITYFSAKKTTGSTAFFAAGRRITGWQNGLAVAGDYISAASFLGMSGTIFLSILVLKYFNFSFSEFFDAITKVQVSDPKTREVATKNFLLPGLKFGAAVTKGWGPLDQVSLGLALVFGTAGLPHILVRFYTVPDAKTACVSVVWAMIIIGLFYILTT